MAINRINTMNVKKEAVLEATCGLLYTKNRGF